MHRLGLGGVYSSFGEEGVYVLRSGVLSFFRVLGDAEVVPLGRLPSNYSGRNVPLTVESDAADPQRSSLSRGGLVFIYGPFKVDGGFTVGTAPLPANGAWIWNSLPFPTALRSEENRDTEAL